jgi:choline dehydrogenase-like flavoprotein
LIDTIVVGGGTAGSVMAARLSEDADWHVVDASSLPRLPRATPYLSVIVLAERIASLMQG